MTRSEPLPRGVWIPAAFFAVGGLLEISFSLREAARPLTFWPVWEAIGRGLLNLLVGFGLLRRVALCRHIALVYCLVSLAMYGAVLVLAFTSIEVNIPQSVVWKSLYEVPSCALLFPYLRSLEAVVLFSRPLFD